MYNVDNTHEDHLESPAEKDQRRRDQQAEQSLALASRYLTANEPDKALNELSRALVLSPGLARNRQAARLASQLLNIADPNVAIATLQERIEARLSEKPERTIDWEAIQLIAVALCAGVVLFLALAAFYKIYNRDLVSIVGAGLTNARVNAFLRALNPATFSRAWLPALMLLISILVGNLSMYLLSTSWLGGTVGMVRFYAAIMVAQALTVILAILCICFMPVVTLIPMGETYAAALSSPILAFGLFWNFLSQGYIIARLVGVNMVKGSTVVIVGMAVFYILARMLLNLTLRGISG